MTPPLIIIAAMSENRVIGRGDGMPWDVPEEYEQYREFIKDQTVIMGRRSFEIFREDLTSRHAVVVSGAGASFDDAATCGSLSEAVDKARSYGRTVFFNGGASIYEQALPLVGEMYLSVIKGQYAGDAFFPEFDEAAWTVAERREHPRFEFRRYRRKEKSGAS